MFSGDEISFTALWETVWFFPYILNNALFWWWSIHRPKLLTLEITVLCFTIYWINIYLDYVVFVQTSAYCSYMNICHWNSTLLQSLGSLHGLSAMPLLSSFLYGFSCIPWRIDMSWGLHWIHGALHDISSRSLLCVLIVRPCIYQCKCM
jgi:hypothetical protein